MTLVAADRFASASLLDWWRQVNPGQLDAPVSFGTDAIGPYLQLALSVGGAGGSFLFLDNDGYVLAQRAKGDVDFACLVQVFDLAFTGPPPGGSPRLAGPCIHSPVRPEAAPQYVTTLRNYYHLVAGRAPGGDAGDTGPVVEWKLTTNNASLWNTVAHPDQTDALCWLRIRRVGTTITSYMAPFQGSTLVVPSSWTQVDTREAANLPDLVDVGLCIYSASGTANIGARIYAVIPILAA